MNGNGRYGGKGTEKKALVVSCCVTRLNSFARAYFVESGVTRRIALHASQNQLTFCVLFPGYVWWLWLKVAWAKRGRRRAFAVRHVHKARDLQIHKCTLFHCRYWSRTLWENCSHLRLAKGSKQFFTSIFINGFRLIFAKHKIMSFLCVADILFASHSHCSCGVNGYVRNSILISKQHRNIIFFLFAV